jgi:DNA-directed RNA polymerase specialized sigma24 family protein
MTEPYRTVPLKDVLAQLPAERRHKIDKRAAELKAEVEGLQALRSLAARSQEQIAQSLGIKQPSVHKMEKQADLYISTLRRFVEAAGGKLELRVELPGKGSFRLTGLGDLHPDN